MIQYGDEDVYSEFHERFSKNGTSFFTAPTGVEEGEHGLVGTDSEYGTYNTYCANTGTCEEYGQDFFNFSTAGDIPIFESVTCGFYTTQGGIYSYWKPCPSGDNEQIMRYWVRY